MAIEKETEQEQLPAIEIKPSEEYHERPLWHKIIAWVLIVMLVIATGICALWPML